MSGYLAMVQHVLEVGLVRTLASKPVRQSIARLVAGTADVGNEYLENWAQRKRSDTLAEKQITSVVVAKAKELAADDPDLAQRGLDRWARKLRARQQSLDEVAIRTISIVGEEELPPEADVPSEGFMRVFEDIAERATTEEVADLLARILAGEIRKPRSLSLRTLQVVSVMDGEIVEALKNLMPYCLDDRWFHIADSRKIEWSPRLALLGSVSIVSHSDINGFMLDETGRQVFRMGKRGIVLRAPHAWKFGGLFTTARLTPIGTELAAILPWESIREVEKVALGFLEIRGVEKVEVGDIVICEMGWTVTNLISVTNP